MKKILIGMLLAPIGLTGCTTTAIVEVGGGESVLELINPLSKADSTGEDPLALDVSIDVDKAEEEKLVESCLKSDDKAALSGSLAIDFIVRPLIGYALDHVESKLKASIAEYTASHSAGVTPDYFYASVDPKPILAWNCFRYQRQIKKQARDNNSETKLLFDLVGQFRLTHDLSSLQIRPLRLYIARPKAKGTIVGISAKLKIDSAWREANVGMFENTIDQTIVSERVTKWPFLKYYNGVNWSSYPPLKLVPWSSESTEETGNVRLSVDIGEAGNAPKHLEKIAGTFSEKKDDISKVIGDAISQILVVESE